MDVFKVRRANLISLVLSKFSGNKAAFSRAAKVHPNHTNLLASDNEKIQRNMGEELARRIERELDLPDVWFDRLHDGVDVSFEVRSLPVDVSLSRALVTSQDIDGVSITAKWVSGMSKRITAVDNLFWATVTTEEMEPILKSGVTVLIDKGVQAATNDGIYVLTKSGVGFLRQVRRLPDGTTLVQAANPDYRSPTLEQLKGMKVVGRIVMSVTETLL